ncbi:hypothetical protein NPIL_110981 [Nephila pilipes]|uniref:Uncharacterized protein n=1 Tax=Nephila pilipes TaxID=299642 RepID=A0A8X6NTU8_NEPPI|nr:hypothetical protein NPIL_110981 [Nephila pilipes]
MVSASRGIAEARRISCRRQSMQRRCGAIYARAPPSALRVVPTPLRCYAGVACLRHSVRCKEADSKITAIAVRHGATLYTQAEDEADRRKRMV